MHNRIKAKLSQRIHELKYEIEHDISHASERELRVLLRLQRAILNTTSVSVDTEVVNSLLSPIDECGERPDVDPGFLGPSRSFH